MSRARETMVGAVILVALLVGVVGTLWLQGTNWGRPTTPVEVLIADVAQLAPGNGVKLRGVQIGRVASIAVEPDGQAVRVLMELEAGVAIPDDAVVLIAPESFFGDWQAEIVSRDRYPRFRFFEVPASEMANEVPVLGGYALPELSRLSASGEQIADNLADLTERFEIAFNEQTAQNLARAIENFGVVSDDLRALVDQQSAIVIGLTSSADSALAEIELASRTARRSFERIDGMLSDGQIDSIVTNVKLATGSIQAMSAELSGSAADVTEVLARADTAITRIGRVVAGVEAGQGVVGRLFSDTTLATRAEGVLGQLDILLQDFRANPGRYVRLSIF